MKESRDRVTNAIQMIDDTRLSSGARSRDFKGHDNHQSIPEELMLFVVKQQKFTRNVVTCDEAGAFGVYLHRWFEKLGIKNYVV